MSFPRYPEYKDSGVEWLRDIPKHWDVLPIKRIVSMPITDGPHETPQFVVDGVPFVSAEAVSSGRIDFSKIRACITAEDNARYSLKYSPKLHDIYMVKSGATTGITAIVEDRTDFNIWSPLAVIRCGDEAVPHFVLNFMRSQNFLEAVTLNWSFGTQQNIGMGVIENLFCTLPPLAEQTQIAIFLDRETAKIDALVTQQRRLMELLKEKRQAVISHAVTRGLNPDAPTKPSGNKWLGDVPAHWEVKRLRYLLAENGLVRGPFGGDLKKEIFQASGVKVYEQKNAIYRDHQLGNSYITAIKFGQMSRFRVSAGDYIMSCSGTIGKTYRLPENAPDGIINQALLVIRFSKKVTFQFADWIFESEFFGKQILDNSQGGAMKNLVGMDVFTSIGLPVPPGDEQLSIAAYLSSEADNFDTLTTEAQYAIDLLQERRAALISAAVTGKIDIRDWS